jgi:thiol:disulfide interchange protein
MKTRYILIALLFMASFQFSAGRGYGQAVGGLPYNENQDARADLKKAIEQAKVEHKHVMVQFGGNWCPWCIRFHQMANYTKPIDSLLKADYVYTLVNVPHEKDKRDFKLFEDYGYPNRFGYPVFVVLNGDGKILHIQDSGILEHCKTKGYDTTKVATFLKMWNVKALDPETYKGLSK